MHDPVTTLPFFWSKHGSKGGRNSFKPVLFLEGRVDRGSVSHPLQSHNVRRCWYSKKGTTFLQLSVREEAKRSDSSKKEGRVASIKEFIFKYLNILERMLEQKFLLFFFAPHVEMSLTLSQMLMQSDSSYSSQAQLNCRYLLSALNSAVDTAVGCIQQASVPFFFSNPPKQRQLYLSPPSPPLCWLGLVK